MAFYIDFNFINIRDLVDLSEIDLEFENQLQTFAEEILENPPKKNADTKSDNETTAMKFLSEIVAENDTTMTEKKSDKNVADVINSMSVSVIAAPKTSIDKKNESYIKYINSKYEQNQADYFINVLLNPLQTHLRNRFDFADARNSYLTSRILGTDKDSAEKARENRFRQSENLRNTENERRAESLKKIELHKLLESKNGERYKRV